MKTKAAADVEAAEMILEILSRTVLEVGEILEKVYVERPSFEQFVVDYLPLQPNTAEKMRAMHLLYTRKNGNDLPEPWKALWSFG